MEGLSLKSSSSDPKVEGPSLVPGTPGNGARGAESILMTLSKREMELFLPGCRIRDTARSKWGFYPSGEHSPGDWLKKLADVRPAVVVTNWSSRPVPDAILEGQDFGLLYICHMAGSVRSLVPRAFLERGGIVSNWGGLVGRQVAEHALLLALSALRDQPSWGGYMRRARSRTDWPIVDIGTRTLFSRHVGIHGFGHVARMLVGLLRPFGVHISAWSEGVPRALYEEFEVAPAESLAGLFSSSDVLFECEALNPKSSGSVDAGVLSKLPDGAVFVNVGRGQVVCGDALLREAESGRITIAIDVLSDEAVAPESPFLRLPHAVLSPHIGGPTFDQFPEIGRFAMANIERYLAGLPLEGVVTLDHYDRAT
jgi:phosphoglycerate dehydrogenase-like enzyme